MASSGTYEKRNGLIISPILFNFVRSEVLPLRGIEENVFWSKFSSLLKELIPENIELIKKRNHFQEQINNWHLENRSTKYNIDDYTKFLKDIGYLVPEGSAFHASTCNVDEEFSIIAGPQLVVPLINARYSLNAANARWGSLYDALYGTNAIENTLPTNKGYDIKRGEKVISWCRDFLDKTIPLINESHSNAINYSIKGGELIIKTKNGSSKIKNSKQFLGFTGSVNSLSSILFQNNNLHIIIKFDPSHVVGKHDNASISDIILESAVTTIMDCEDSIAAVDAEDKVNVYRNWLGLMNGSLSTSFKKAGKNITRSLNQDLSFTSADGNQITVPGRSLMLIRNVGHLMTTDTVCIENDQEIPEGILDTVITSLIAMHNLEGNSTFKNSRKGSIYIVKPKMHGPEEVAFSDKLFLNVENILGLPKNTLKMGIMDEERRTSVNLKECIRAASERIVFINTGFLDRTGDEIHTSMLSGPMIRKEEMKYTDWLEAYEDRNVDIGLECGLQGRAQIGKGMWAMPDLMDDMLKNKISHPKAGANTAWVPSPTAATIHSIHYHLINVTQRQDKLKLRPTTPISKLLCIPLQNNQPLTKNEIQEELNNNIQGILGYVVRWIDQGIGCSKVLNLNNVGLMEDRATLRISSQHINNWLNHGVCTKKQVIETLEKMAKVVDRQNVSDRCYKPMTPNTQNNYAFQAACELIFEGHKQPNGYTEPILHKYRLKVKKNKP